MIGIDTNVLVRYFVQDDVTQSRAATRLLESVLSQTNKGFISSIVLCETVWVLKRCYKTQRAGISRVVKAVLETDVFEVEHRDCAWRAYYDLDEGQADFSDYYIAQIDKEIGASFTASFDAKALKHRLFKSPEAIQ